MLSGLEAHGLCIGLVVLDQVARAFRIRVLCGATGHPLRFRDALSMNAIGDAACAVTPMRLGGEPVRIASLLRFGVPATAVFVAVAFEVITMWPVIILSALGIGYWFAPGWIAHTAPLLLRGLARSWVWLALAVLGSLLLFFIVRRRVHVTTRVTRRPWRRVLVYGRRMPMSVLVLAAGSAFVNLATRTAILPILMATLPDPPPLGPAIVGSFALLYTQLVLPTPSGAGVVDLGFLAGAAGSAGGAEVPLLIWWRFYTTFIGVALGSWLAVRVFGWGAVRALFRGKGKGKEGGR
jgi:uncharacterized membrane protein YbhN (UPF0104 family)